MDWFSGLQKNLTAAAADAADRAQKLAQQASVQAKAYAEQASIQAKVYAEQATVTAKVLAQQATEEAQHTFAQLTQAAAATPAAAQPQPTAQDLNYYGINDALIEFVSNMSYSTFSDSTASLPKPAPGESFRLSAWQEKHVLLLLGRVEQLQHLRYALCPKRMDEQQFWTIYFAEVKQLLPPQAFGLPEVAAPGPSGAPGPDAAVAAGAAAAAAGASGDGARGQASAGAEPGAGSSRGDAAEPRSRLASGSLAAAGTDAAGTEDAAAGDSSDAEDGEQLDELEDDPELAAYLQEALALDDEQGDVGSADLGSVADEDLDDYINQLQDEEVHSKLSTPAKVPDE